MMTPKEISELVNQPVPRKIPLGTHLDLIPRYIDIYHILLVSLLATVSILAFESLPRAVDYMLLDFGIGNRMTAQGAITSITPQRPWSRMGPTRYALNVRFSTLDGERNIFSYVLNRRNIPGWGVIPETQNTQDLRGTLRLGNPFSVTIEYIPGRLGAARVIGTRSSFVVHNLILMIIIAYLGNKALIFILKPHRIRVKRLLREGAFVTGYIIPKQKNPVLSLATIKRLAARHASSYAASFTDQRGVRCEVPILLPYPTWNLEWLLPDLAHEGSSAGLLYLPDKKEVIVTDMLGYSWDPGRFTKPINPAKLTADESAFLERLKNMPQEEAEKEILTKLDDLDRKLDSHLGIFSWIEPRQDYTSAPEKPAKHTKHITVAEREAASWNHIENMSQEEITAKLKEMSERRNSDK